MGQGPGPAAHAPHLEGGGMTPHRCTEPRHPAVPPHHSAPASSLSVPAVRDSGVQYMSALFVTMFPNNWAPDQSVCLSVGGGGGV